MVKGSSVEGCSVAGCSVEGCVGSVAGSLDSVEGCVDSLAGSEDCGENEATRSTQKSCPSVSPVGYHIVPSAMSLSISTVLMVSSAAPLLKMMP